RLDRVAEEERAGLPLEAEAVDDLRLPVAGPVDLDVVPGARRERVVVRPRGRILTRDLVRGDGGGGRLVRGAESVEVRVVGCRILRDQRRLPVARGLARLRSRVSRCCCEYRGAGDRQDDECELAHWRCGSFRSRSPLVRASYAGGSEITRRRVTQ